MGRFNISSIGLDGAFLVCRKKMIDSRGFLDRIYCNDELSKAGWNKPIAQINHTKTAKAGTTRGLHAQKKPFTEMKMVSCIRGAILDIILDIRPKSNTFLQWKAIELSEQNCLSVIIPEGFAHGFQSLVDDSEIIYLHSATYNPEFEITLNILDPILDISLPLSISEVSDKDKNAQFLNSNFIEILKNEM